MTEYDPAAFDAFEAAGWETVAHLYDRFWSPLTSLAVDPLLDAAGITQGMRVLDVGTGSGAAAGRAAERGAIATGVDVAAAMVKIAGQRHPSATFVQGSATSLAFEEGSFDAVVGNIVIQHIGAPELAAAEMARVLVSNGRVALSTWEAPERSPFFAAILGSVADADVPPPSEVPAGPAFFQFADATLFAGLLAGAGFRDVQIDTISFEMSLGSAGEVVEALAEGTVRTGALIRGADDERRARILSSLEARLEPWRRGDSYAVRAAISIGCGRKP